MFLASIVRSVVQRVVRFVVFGIALFFAIDGRADEIAKQWRGVTRVRGSITVEYSEWVHEGGIREGEESDKREAAELQFVMEVDSSPGSTGMVWRATSATIAGSIHGSTAFHINKSLGPSTVEAEYSGVPVSLGDFTLTLDPSTGVWQLASPGKLRQKYPIVSRFYGDDPDVVTEKSDVVPSVLFNGTVRGKPGAVAAVYQDEYALTDQPLRGVSKVGRLQLWPEYDDVAVEVTIEGYAKWRPEGSIATPTKPGNHLVARATLVPGGGRVQDLPAVKNFRFELVATSSEPGVCLNWPLEAKLDQEHAEFDLRLAAAPPFLGELSDKDQKNVVTQALKDERGQPYADTQIDSYDFGGRSELRAVCVLADGREVLGVFKDADGSDGVALLPQRFSGDWIAKKWRADHDVLALAADDDGEETEGNDFKGDGFTLYEEYRGFAVQGRHVEGDPKKKDLCILNLVGSDAWAGIHMFEAATGLRAIHRLLPTEMAQDLRLMNRNHRDAPHRVDQHGVWIKAFGAGELDGHGAATLFIKGGVSGRPGNTAHIGVPFKADATSDFSQPWNLSPDDQAIAYDRAVAHEIAHSVGVKHHGNSDRGGVYRYVSADDPRKLLGRHSLFVGAKAEGGPVTVLREEEPHEDILVREAPILERLLRELPLQWSEDAQADAKTRAFIVDSLLTCRWYVGSPHGQCSGNEQCLMRYYFAQVYPKNGDNRVLYFIARKTEKVGVILCTSPKGTGVNDANTHEPQSRYFDANEDLGCGNCRAQTCPNDAIPPGPRANNL